MEDGEESGMLPQLAWGGISPATLGDVTTGPGFFMSQNDLTHTLPGTPKGGSGSDPNATQTSPSAQSQVALPRELPRVEMDRYDTLKEFAHGAMGRILQARDRRLDRPVAIKELL